MKNLTLQMNGIVNEGTNLKSQANLNSMKIDQITSVQSLFNELSAATFNDNLPMQVAIATLSGENGLAETLKAKSNGSSLGLGSIYKILHILLSPIFLPTGRKTAPGLPVVGLTDTCMEQTNHIISIVASKTENPSWFMNMVDSWGKPSSGIMQGEYGYPGDMEECLNVDTDLSDQKSKFTPFKGKYCTVNLNKNKILGMLVPHYGTCIPSGCKQWEFQESITNHFQMIGVSGVTVDCYTEQFPSDWGTWEIMGTLVIAVVFSIVVIATAYEILAPKRCNPKLKAFSAASNAEKIMAVRLGNPSEITCFHAIRVLSICWVLLGHQNLFIISSIGNIMSFLDMTKNPGMQIIWSGYRAVDTFFFLGGLLLTKSLLSHDFCIKKRQLTDEKDFMSTERLLWEEIKKQGLITTITTFVKKYIMYVIIRIIRIWPGLFMITMFYAGPSKLFVSGPNQSAYSVNYLESCRKNWWYDLTFFNNFIESGAYDKTDANQACLGQSWYVAVDFQIYLIMPFLILPVKLMKWKQAYLWLLTIISCIIPGVIIIKNNLGIGGVFNNLFSEYHELIYVKPWARMTPYMVGALCALWLIQLEKNKKSGRELMEEFYKKHPAIAAMYPRLLGWASVTAIALAVVFGLCGRNSFSTTYVFSDTESFMYGAFDILAWSLVLAWVVMMCTMGLAEPVNFFLSHPMWQPLARLSFGVYLVSQPLQILILSSFQQYIYITFNMLLLLLGGVIILSFMAAFALSIIAESPAINLLRFIR